MNVASQKADADLDGLFERLTKLADDAGAVGRRKGSPVPADNSDHSRFVARDDELAVAATAGGPSSPGGDAFLPMAPRSLAETGVSENEIEAIILRLPDAARQHDGGRNRRANRTSLHGD